jgi:hypothetical protein
VPLITIIIRSLKKPAAAAAAHSTQELILNTSLPSQFRQIRLESRVITGRGAGRAALI